MDNIEEKITNIVKFIYDCAEAEANYDNDMAANNIEPPFGDALFALDKFLSETISDYQQSLLGKLKTANHITIQEVDFKTNKLTEYIRLDQVEELINKKEE